MSKKQIKGNQAKSTIKIQQKRLSKPLKAPEAYKSAEELADYEMKNFNSKHLKR